MEFNFSKITNLYLQATVILENPEKLILELQETPSSGFSWSINPESNNDILVKKILIDDDFKKSEIAGNSVRIQYQIEFLTKKETNILLQKKQPFDPNSQDVSEIKLKIKHFY